MSAQQRFQEALQAQQEASSMPNKMPYLCVLGAFDFDELGQEILTQFEAAKQDVFDQPEHDPDPGYDERQLGSLTATLEYCGCRCFRALCIARGFFFA
jgi:hypothetical protein